MYTSCNCWGKWFKLVFTWELCILFCIAKDKRTTIMQCFYDSLLKSHASFDGRKTILCMSYSFLANRKTGLSCDRLAKSWTFFNRMLHGTYILCTIILQLSASFMMSAILSAIWLRLTAVRKLYDKKTYVWCKQGLTRREPTFCRALEKMWCTLQCERAFLMTWRIKVESAYIDVSKQMGSCFQDTSCKGTALKKSCNLNCCIQSLFSFLIEVSVRPGGPEPRNGEILLRFTMRASVA